MSRGAYIQGAFNRDFTAFCLQHVDIRISLSFVMFDQKPSEYKLQDDFMQFCHKWSLLSCSSATFSFISYS